MWKLADATVRGRGHEKNNIPCQDKTCVLSLHGVSVICLADGAGSASLSHYGAEAVTSNMALLLCERFDSFYEDIDGEFFKDEIFKAIYDTLEVVACKNNCDMKELASTLLVSAVHNNKYIIIHIGDGVIGYVKNHTIKVASSPSNGEFSNETVFTTSNGGRKLTKIIKGELDGISGFVLMSDGVESALFDFKTGNLVPSLDIIFNDLSISEIDVVKNNLLDTLQDIASKKTFDDCSIALMVYCDIKNEINNNTDDIIRNSSVINKGTDAQQINKNVSISFGDRKSSYESETSTYVRASSIKIQLLYTAIITIITVMIVIVISSLLTYIFLYK